MKEITIFQKNNPPILFIDEDISDLSDYTKQLTSLLEVQNVVILETTSGSVIIKPHTISSIKVINIEETKHEIINNEQNINNKTEDIITEDIITDGD